MGSWTSRPAFFLKTDRKLAIADNLMTRSRKDVRDASRSISRSRPTPAGEAAARLHVDKLDHGAGLGDRARPKDKSETEKVGERAGSQPG